MCRRYSFDEVSRDTMESLCCKNLYLAGELLDVDGICGGYNLQWAWASGYLRNSRRKIGVIYDSDQSTEITDSSHREQLEEKIKKVLGIRKTDLLSFRI